MTSCSLSGWDNTPITAPNSGNTSNAQIQKIPVQEEVFTGSDFDQLISKGKSETVSEMPIQSPKEIAYTEWKEFYLARGLWTKDIQDAETNYKDAIKNQLSEWRKSIADIEKTKDIWASVKAEMSVDEILVHEMLHYISHKVNPAKRTMQVEEEFAYGNSADYLRSKGHDDDFIIKKNFMPYLIMVSISSLNVDVGSLNEEENKKVFDLTFKNAYNLGKSILEIWDNKKHGKSSSEASIEKKVISIDFD